VDGCNEDREERLIEALENLSTEELRQLVAEIEERLPSCSSGNPTLTSIPAFIANLADPEKMIEAATARLRARLRHDGDFG
jgi:hypothetical protein